MLFPAFRVNANYRSDLLDNTLEREYTSLDFNETWVESIRNNRRLLMLGMNYGL